MIRERRRWPWVIASLVVLYALAGFFVLPPIVRGQMEKRLSALLGRKVTVERVRLNPFALSVTVEGFDVRTADGKGSFLGWGKFYANFEALSSVTGSWVLGQVSLDGFHAAVEVEPDGRLSVADIVAKLVPPGAKDGPPAAPGRPVRVEHLDVSGAQAEFTDRSRGAPFHTVVGPMDFSLTDFRTAAGPDAPYHFAAKTDAGETLEWKGTLSAVPLASKGELRLANIDLPKYAPYFKDRLNGRIESGRLTVSGRYDARLDGPERRMLLEGGAVQLRELWVVENDGHLVADLPMLTVKGIKADALTLKATIASVQIKDAQLDVRRDADGSINVLKLIPAPVAAPAAKPPASTPAVAAATPAAKASPPAAAAAPAPVPQVEIDEVTADNVSAKIRDLAVATPASLTLDKIHAKVTKVTLAAGAKMPVEVSLDWKPAGTVKLSGEVSLQPVHADLQVEVAGLALPPLSPYLEQAVKARLAEGRFSLKGHVAASMPENGPPAITFTGDAGVDAFGLVDAAHAGKLAGFGALAITGIAAETAPKLKASVEEVKVTAPYARAVVGTDKVLNFATVLPAEAAKAGAAPAPSAGAAPPAVLPEIAVKRVVVEKGDFSFTDQSVEPNVNAAVKDFAATLRDLSSLQPGRGQADVQAKIDGVSAFTVTGQLDPLAANPQADLTVATHGVDLLPIGPYVGKYAGFALARGKLSVDVKAKLADRKLDVANVVTLDQFTLGRATNSPDATHLPVRLGIALLKDTDGKIVIDMPVQGSLDDPNFKIGRVVLRVIVNLLTKAATSPFKLLGSMFGGGGDELGQQDFLPGETAPTPESLARLATLEKALNARPGLNLDIEGGYDTAADSHVLKRTKVREEVRHRIWLERHAQNPDLPPPDKLEIGGDEFAAGLKKMFDEKFPPGTTFGTPVPAAPEMQPPPEPPRGFFRRAIDAITFKTAREKKAWEKAQAEAQAQHEADVAKAIETGLPVEEMLGRLAEATDVTTDDLRALAAARAQTVRDRLMTEGKIAGDRLFLSQADGDGAARLGARVELHLQ